MERSWEKPEMMILVRRKADETILAACKSSGGDPSLSHGVCVTPEMDQCN